MRIGLSTLQGFVLGFEVLEVNTDVAESIQTVQVKEILRIYLFFITLNIFIT
jgi:hypothetical protein